MMHTNISSTETHTYLWLLCIILLSSFLEFRKCEVSPFGGGGDLRGGGGDRFFGGGAFFLFAFFPSSREFRGEYEFVKAMFN